MERLGTLLALQLQTIAASIALWKARAKECKRVTRLMQITHQVDQQSKRKRLPFFFLSELLHDRSVCLTLIIARAPTKPLNQIYSHFRDIHWPRFSFILPFRHVRHVNVVPLVTKRKSFFPFYLVCEN